MRKRIDQLNVGDLVDLEGDPYADPNHTNPAFPFEYAEVCEIERETPNCIAVGFEGFDVVGFPPDHTVEVSE